MYPHHLHHQNRPFPVGCDLVAAIPPTTQRVEIILLKPELLHDIEAATAHLEKVRQANAPAGSQAVCYLPDGASGSYLLSRHIDTAVNQAVARCQAYLMLPSPYAHRVSTDHAYGWEEKSIYLAMPSGWPPHCMEPLRDAVHNFIVYRALQLFLSFSDEKAAALSESMALTAYDDINAQLSARHGPTNVHPTFLG